MEKPRKRQASASLRSFRRQKLVIFALLASDLLVGFGAWGPVAVLTETWTSLRLWSVLLAVAVPSLALWVSLRWLLGLYPGYGIDSAQELRLQTYSSVLVLAAGSFAAAASEMGGRFLLLLPLVTFGLVLAVPVARSATKWMLVRTGLWGKPVVVLGGGETSAQLVRRMLRDRRQGFKPLAFFSDEEWLEDQPVSPGGVPYLGHLDDAPGFAARAGINTAVLAIGGLEHASSSRLADWASTKFERVIVSSTLTGLSSSATVTHDLTGVLGIEVKHNLLDPRARAIKRVLDLFGAVVGGALISPLLLALVLLVKVDSPGPVFFAQTRVGTGGHKFRCWKFRTMRRDSEAALSRLLEGDLALREQWETNHKLRSDPRITRIGRLLRKTSLDELPQLWNVLLGEMSLVGPRPIVPAEIPKYTGSYDLYTRVRPGITGLWQVRGRSSTSYEERVSLDTYYVRNWSIWLDLMTLSHTVVSVLLRQGAY